MRQREKEPGLFYPCFELVSFLQVQAKGLVANHVKAVFKRGVSRTEMEVIGRYDGYKIHANVFRELFFGGNHGRIVGIHPTGIQEERFTGSPGSFGLAAESTTNQLNLSIKRCRHAVNGTNKSPMAPTDHAHPDFSFHNHTFAVDKETQ